MIQLISFHVIEEKAAQALIDRLHNNPSGVIQERKKTKKKEAQRLPLSLSSLQVLAGKRYGYDPQQVLDAAQQLYERKLTTYPRSDCEYLPWGSMVRRILCVCTQGRTGVHPIAELFSSERSRGGSIRTYYDYC